MRRPTNLTGTLRMPGDKSISHRAVILNSLADGDATFTNLSTSADVVSTLECVRALGVDADSHRISGVGLHGLRRAAAPLQCGNSGTTMRLLAGLLAAQPFESELTGDASLLSRPMDRVVGPLREMGASVPSAAPLRVGGDAELVGTIHQLPVASAQVKSALLLAGLYAGGTTTITEPLLSRNHTELMLAAMHAPIQTGFRDGRPRVSIAATEKLDPVDVEIPGDLSAAVFWLVAAGATRGAHLTLPSVLGNPTRNHVVTVLSRTGYRIQETNERLRHGERVVDVVVSGGDSRAPIALGAGEAQLLIDELPALAVAATSLHGTSRFQGAGELRVKESDRIRGIVDGLRAMGGQVRELDDGFEVDGPADLEGARVRTNGDHRIAMALAVAGMLASGQTEIEDAECVAVSYPEFWRHAEMVGAVC